MYESKKPLTGLFAEVVEEVVNLFQTEIRLVRTELSERFSRVANGGTLLAVGAVLLLGAFFVFLQDIVTWLAVAGLPVQWGYLIVGVVLVIVGGVILSIGVSRVNPKNLVPERSIKELKADVSAVTEHVP